MTMKFKTFMEDYLHRLGVFAKNKVRATEHYALDPTALPSSLIPTISLSTDIRYHNDSNNNPRQKKLHNRNKF